AVNGLDGLDEELADGQLGNVASLLDVEFGMTRRLHDAKMQHRDEQGEFADCILQLRGRLFREGQLRASRLSVAVCTDRHDVAANSLQKLAQLDGAFLKRIR